MKSKIFTFFLAFLAVSAFLSLYHTPEAEAMTFTGTKTFTSLTDDAYGYGLDVNYLNAAKANRFYSYSINSEWLTVGQAYSGGAYFVFRAYLYFDTSLIPDGATITSAVLSLYVSGDFSATDFDVVIQNGQPNYPHKPLISEDYNYLYYIGNGGSRSTSTISGTGYWNITLNSDGRSWINKAGVTKLCLKSSRDVSWTNPLGTTPTGNEYIEFYSAEKGLAYAPKLYVTYQVDVFRYIFHGPYSEQTALKSGNITVWVYPASGSPFNFTLDGVYTLDVEQKPLYFRIQLPEYNYSRYYLPVDSYEDIYVFKPADPYYYYYVDLIDTVGLTNAYMETYITVNGTTFTVERRPVIQGQKTPFVFNWGWQYGIRVVADQGVFDFGAQTPLAEQTLTFIVTVFSFPQGQTTVYESVSVSAVRVNASTITVGYLDSKGRTNRLNVTIYRVDLQNTLVQEYSTSQTVNSYSLTWRNAEANKDYIVQIAVNHADYGVLNWSFPCPKPASTSNPWNFDWLGNWPIDSTQLIGILLTLCIFACFSVKDIHIGLLLGIVFAALLTYIGWLNIPWTTITTCMCLAVFYALSRRRQT